MATTETTEIKKPAAYQSTWQDQLKDIANRILNREKFSYDFNADPLYNQYKSQYVNQGRMAMMDTMGQAAAMTGGYGNSYAQGVGQQAFNGYLQQMNNIIPELYQLALNQHQMEGDELTSKFAVLGAQDDKDYGRYRDTMSDYYLDQEFAYQKDRDKVADSQWQAEFDEAVRQFNFANELGEFAPVASSGGGGSGGGSKGGNNNYAITEDMMKNGGYNSAEMLQIIKSSPLSQSQQKTLTTKYQKPKQTSEVKESSTKRKNENSAYWGSK